jgi:hypothetical protein
MRVSRVNLVNMNATPLVLRNGNVALFRGEWSASILGCFFPGAELVPIGSEAVWARVSLDGGCGEERNFCLCRESNSVPVVRSHSVY